jgi:homoaconitase/3-isopropylmalate dehydratase large subunit
MIAAEALKGREVHKEVELIVTPGSRAVKQKIVGHELSKKQVEIVLAGGALNYLK